MESLYNFLQMADEITLAIFMLLVIAVVGFFGIYLAAMFFREIVRFLLS